MKNTLFITVLLMLIVNISKGQKYIDGHGVISILSIANGPILQNHQRLTMDQAFIKLKEVYPDSFEKAVDDMIGEYWWIDSMLVNIVPREITVDYPKESLTDIQQASIPDPLYKHNAPPDRTLPNDYFTEIKSINNFNVLINYFKTLTNYKSFTIQDHLNRYQIMGTIYVKKEDASKAHAFIYLLLNNITFQ